MKYEGKTALVTGVSTEIGFLFAEELGKKGARVYGVDYKHPCQDPAHFSFVTREDRVCLDMDEIADIRYTFEHLPARLDILVTSTAPRLENPVGQNHLPHINRMINTNVKAPLLLFEYGFARLDHGAKLVYLCSADALNLDIEAGLHTVTQQSAVNLAHMIERTHPQFDVKIAYLGPVEQPEKVTCYLMQLLESKCRDLVYAIEEHDHYFLENLCYSTGFRDPALELSSFLKPGDQA